MTTDEFLALPDDGTDRMLIRGVVYEYAPFFRDRFGSATMALLSCELSNWNDKQPLPQGMVLAGSAGFELATDPDTVIGIDFAYASPDLLARQDGSRTILVGVPTLAVEILSPGEVTERAQIKIDTYLAAGVPLVWILDPHYRTVTAYRPGEDPVLFGSRQELTAGDTLPGFRLAVASLFV